MSKFEKKRGKNTPGISTSSLPDIIFMLLFFFMTVTVMRTGEIKVAITTPSASELTKLEQKSLVSFIYVGRPQVQYQSEMGSAPRMQLGDKFSELSDIRFFLEKHKLKLPENQKAKVIASMKIDKDITMGIVSDIKDELRKAGQLKVNYSAKRKN
jgi:biopolymer transport protein ExbD